uniref:Protein ripply3 n=1 Tax=Leptobrachium leishanense TaxID=445787 RepID=A0A8C5MAF6_9ANUR
MDSAQCKLKAAFTHMYPCPRVPSNASSEAPGHPDRNPELWRPWVFSAGDRQKRLLAKKTDANYGNTGGAHGFQHPVRLYMPKSKTDEYTQHMGKKVLANFPVQATIHFYNDDSDTEDDDDDECEMELNVNYQNVDCDPQNTSRNTMEDNSACSTSLTVGLDQEHS